MLPTPTPTIRVLTESSAADTPAHLSTEPQAVAVHRRQLDASSSELVVVAAVSTRRDKSTTRVADFIAHMDGYLCARLGSDFDSLAEQEKMACLYEDECLGGVKDYTDAFRRAFGVQGSPRCKDIVDDIRTGGDSMALTYWKQQMTQQYGCPFPTKHGSARTA